jgi:hypothetical protein
MTYRDLHRRLNDHPFRPFRIRMVNSTVYDIRQPWMVIVGESSAVIATDTRKDDRGIELALDWKTVSIQHMMEFTDLDVRSNGAKRKK